VQGPQVPPTMPTGTKVFTPTFYSSTTSTNSGSVDTGSTTTGPAGNTSSSSSSGQPPATGQGAATGPAPPSAQGTSSGQASSPGQGAGAAPAVPQATPPTAPGAVPAPRPAITPPATRGESGTPAPASIAPSGGTGRLYQITAGPIYGQRRAEDIARRLASSGSAVGVTMKNLGTLPHYRVVSEALPPGTAARRAAALGDIHPQREALADGNVRLLYGDFGSQQQAVALRAKIQTRGYTASIEAAQAPAYSATVLTPFQKAALDTSIAIIESGGDVPVEVRPVH
jgi:hypothetical protein